MAFRDYILIEKRIVSKVFFRRFREILEINDPITNDFNRLSEKEKQTVLAIAGVTDGDKVQPLSMGDRMAHYNNEGYLKIARAMWRIKSLASRLPSDSALLNYTTEDYLRGREDGTFKRKH
ncbi:hypothetical protein HZ320_11125 [[Pasteurella] aerogenes]|nr:hypothetical protein HZ320_11125 [[Pasteurella] aerogenes]